MRRLFLIASAALVAWSLTEERRIYRRTNACAGYARWDAVSVVVEEDEDDE